MKEIIVINSKLLTKLLGTTKITNNWKRNKYIKRHGRSFKIDHDFLAYTYIQNMKQLSKMKESIDMIETYFDNEDFVKILQKRLKDNDSNNQD